MNFRNIASAAGTAFVSLQFLHRQLASGKEDSTVVSTSQENALIKEFRELNIDLAKELATSFEKVKDLEEQIVKTTIENNRLELKYTRLEQSAKSLRDAW